MRGHVISAAKPLKLERGILSATKDRGEFSILGAVIRPDQINAPNEKDGMMVDDILYYIGLFHVASYALAGSLFILGLIMDWAIMRCGLTRDVLNALIKIYKEKRVK